MELAKENFNTNTLEKFLGICVNVVNQHATCKKKTLRGNDSSFMNKELSKTIMTRTKLRNKFQKNRTEGNLRPYTRQRNYCLLLLYFKNFTREFYGNINEKDVTDNKTFWKTMKPLPSDGTVTQSKLRSTK